MTTIEHPSSITIGRMGSGFSIGCGGRSGSNAFSCAHGESVIVKEEGWMIVEI